MADDALALATVVVRHCLLPNPAVVAQFTTPVFASIRSNRALGARGTIVAQGGHRVLLDDNTTPRWSLLVTHGYGPNLPSGSRGWSIAHVWPRAQCAESYCALGNLALVPLALASLTDGASPVADYLRFHAWSAYGWRPPDVPLPEKPAGYASLGWRYLRPNNDAPASIEAFLSRSSNAWVALLRTLE
ncbi:MAG: hypothetical protein ACEQR8_00975 [Cypionkella sp.]